MKKHSNQAKKRSGRDYSTIILICVFLLGLSVLLYPTISDYWNSRTQSRAVAGYSDTVANMDEATFADYFDAAEDYNQRLLELDSPLTTAADTLTDYDDTLDISGTGIMGYVTIPRIKVELPIYHGTSDGVLQVAAGHLEGSSLPVGGKGTHSVLVAHRGLPSARLFTNLDELEVGDTFTITILNEVLTYEVDKISIVLPTELDALAIDPDEDYCTLLTCTPYGINTHRLLVRGVRIATEDGTQIYVAPEAHKIDAIIVAPVVAAPILLLMLIFLLVKYRKKDKKEKK